MTIDTYEGKKFDNELPLIMLLRRTKTLIISYYIVLFSRIFPYHALPLVIGPPLNFTISNFMDYFAECQGLPTAAV